MAVIVKASNTAFSFLKHGACRRFLPAACGLHTSGPAQNSNRTSIARLDRLSYSRTYPILLVQPDGSTITIQYKEPCRILTMPVDFTMLSEEERKARRKKRDLHRKSRDEQTKEELDDFNLDDYSKYFKKK